MACIASKSTWLQYEPRVQTDSWKISAHRNNRICIVGLQGFEFIILNILLVLFVHLRYLPKI